MGSAKCYVLHDFVSMFLYSEFSNFSENLWSEKQNSTYIHLYNHHNGWNQIFLHST
jgi:hypothetical protein